eukprot:scaffold220368_cov46-Prasinocladus_malaysianus.AAC.1
MPSKETRTMTNVDAMNALGTNALKAPVCHPGLRPCRKPPPLQKPSAQTQEGYTPFDGQLVDRHTTEDGSEYIRLVFGLSQGEQDPARVVDAEFVFPPDDDIVLLRAASRAEPVAGEGTLRLSFTGSPLRLDNNYARCDQEPD